MTDAAHHLATATRASLVAPAGFGKTDVIARAVAHHTDGPQLVLTHTHAGVRALRERLAKHGAHSRDFHLDTIAGFSLRYAASRPKTAQLTTLQPKGAEWEQVYGAAERLIRTSSLSNVLRHSFKGVLVDEYQDCSPAQHSLIMQLAELLPTRIVGDPLQGVFEFGGVVDWEVAVFPNFPRLDDLETPWRWRSTNPELGDWLIELRTTLLTDRDVDLDGAPIDWIPSTHRARQLAACKDLATAAGSVVAIRKWPPAAHSLAQSLGGAYTSMEEVESRDLQKWAKKIEDAHGVDRAAALVDFASACTTGIGSDFGSLIKTLRKGKSPRARSEAKQAVVQALVDLAATDDLIAAVPAMESIQQAATGNLYRGELWTEMTRSIEVFAEEKDHGSLTEAAWVVRDRGRHTGRRVAPKIVSRTLLVKGLEFDHAIVVDASEFEKRDLYVAMTRGSRSLTVLSEDRFINPA